MGVAERGSIIWFMMAVTQIWLSLKLMEEVSAAVTTLFGASAAAFFVLAMVVFKQEQRELLMNPMKDLNREIRPEEVTAGARRAWYGVLIWIAGLAILSSFVG